MFNFKKIGKKVLSSVLGATLTIGGFLNTQIVKAGDPDRERHLNSYTMLSLAGFILGENKKDDIEKLKKEFEKELSEKLLYEKFIEWDYNVRVKKILEADKNLAVVLNGLKSRLENKLDKEGKKVYDVVKKFITCKKANLWRLVSIGEIKKVENFGYGLKCKIATFGIGGTKKAIVGVSVSNNETFENFHMEKIIGNLKGIEEEDKPEKQDFKNVYLIIRSKKNDRKFSINYDIMENLENATVVTPGAKFDENVTISENSTLIANGAEFYEAVTVKAGGNLTANGADFEDVIVNGNDLTINISNANFNFGCSCTINAQNSKINLTGCDFEKIEFENGCKNLTITVSDNKVAEFYQKYKDKVLGSNVFKSINKVTWEEIAGLHSKHQNNSENFLNEFKKLKRKKEGEEQKQDITNNNNGNNGNNNENNSGNIDIYTNNNDILDNGNNKYSYSPDNKETNNSNTNIDNNINILNSIVSNGDNKKEEESKIKKVLKYGGISGLIGLAVVAPIVAFKDKIKVMFLSKKIVKTPACKVKTPVV